MFINEPLFCSQEISSLCFVTSHSKVTFLPGSLSGFSGCCDAARILSPRLFSPCTCECNITGGSCVEGQRGRTSGPALRAEYCPPNKKGGRRYKKFAKPRLVATIRCAAGRGAEHGRRSNLAQSRRIRQKVALLRHNTAPGAPPGGNGGKFFGEAAESCSLPVPTHLSPASQA